MKDEKPQEPLSKEEGAKRANEILKELMELSPDVREIVKELNSKLN